MTGPHSQRSFNGATFIYADPSIRGAWIEEFWCHESFVFDANYNRVAQFGGNPGFFDVFEEDFIEQVVRFAIAAELDLASNGTTKIIGTNLDLDIVAYDNLQEQMFQYTMSGDPAELDGYGDEIPRILPLIAENAAKRAAKSLALLY